MFWWFKLILFFGNAFVLPVCLRSVCAIIINTEEIFPLALNERSFDTCTVHTQTNQPSCVLWSILTEEPQQMHSGILRCCISKSRDQKGEEWAVLWSPTAVCAEFTGTCTCQLTAQSCSHPTYLPTPVLNQFSWGFLRLFTVVFAFIWCLQSGKKRPKSAPSVLQS